MLPALVLVLATQVPPVPRGDVKKPGPPASETAKLYFLAGDIAKAQEWARSGMKKEPKVCKPMLQALAEYAFLANHVDELTPEQARQFIELDRKISPQAQAKLTLKVIDRYVEKPLSIAEARASGGDAKSAVAIAETVLSIDPANARALALKKPAPDAGR